MNFKIDDIIDFLRNLSGTDKIEADSDIFGSITMGGDDFHEMIEAYAKKFSVNMSGYFWYFHADGEGQNFGGLFFTPYNQVRRIPVTPILLTAFANSGKWDIQYPDHKLPKKRYDLLINTIIIGVCLVGILTWLIMKLKY